MVLLGPVNRLQHDYRFLQNGKSAAVMFELLKKATKRSLLAMKLAEALRKVLFHNSMYLRYWKPITIGRDYLGPVGYFNAGVSDAHGASLPWFSYPATHFLESVVQKNWSVFEYGSGYSTEFWNRKCRRVVSVEHDEKWFYILRERNKRFELHLLKEGADRGRHEIVELIRSFEAQNFCLPQSTSVYFNKYHGLENVAFADYAAKLMDFPKGFFDVIVVDGMARCLCTFVAAEYISDAGIIILDNADRWQYNAAHQYLIDQKGFNRLDFHGLGPVNTYGWTTSIFFKQTDFVKHAKTAREEGAGDLGRCALG